MPATVPVHVLCDQGLGRRDLWAQIVAFGDPCMVGEGSSPWLEGTAVTGTTDRRGPLVRVSETDPELGRHARVFPEPVQLPGSKIRARRAPGKAGPEKNLFPA